MQHFLLIPLTLIFIACNNIKNQRYSTDQISALHLDSAELLKIEDDSVEVIDINSLLKEQSFDFESLINEIKLIPLETTVNSLVDDIYKVIVTDSHIYIHDKFKGGGLIVFNTEGKFVLRIPNGKGPGELNRLHDIDFDNDNKELIAYQHPYLLFFNANGQYLRQESVPFGFYNFISINNRYVFKTLDEIGNEHLGHLKTNTLLITDRKFKMEYTGLPQAQIRVNFGGHYYLHKNIELYVTESFSDFIYQIDTLSYKLNKKYILDFNSKKLPGKFLQNNFDEFLQACRNNDYYYYLGDYLNIENHHVFSLVNNHKGHTLIVYRDKKNGEIKGGTSANFSLAEIPPIAFPRWASGNYFISTYLPDKNDLFASKSTLLSTGDKMKISGLNENDNPVLVLFNLKPF